MQEFEQQVYKLNDISNRFSQVLWVPIMIVFMILFTYALYLYVFDHKSHIDNKSKLHQS